MRQRADFTRRIRRALDQGVARLDPGLVRRLRLVRLSAVAVDRSANEPQPDVEAGAVSVDCSRVTLNDGT